MIPLRKSKKPKSRLMDLISNTYATRTPVNAAGEAVKPTPLSRLSQAAVRSPQNSEPPVIPLPDEEELERVRRRRNAKRAGGRSSTVLTDETRLGG